MNTAIIFVLVLGILIFVHELGHFLTARKLGIGVEEFGFGYPPRIFGILVSKKKKNKVVTADATDSKDIPAKSTARWKFFWGNKIKSENLDRVSEDQIIYSLNLLPLGGFVKILGENGEQSNNPENFANQAAWKRSLVLSAGVIMNFIFAFLLLSVGFLLGLPQTIDQNTPLDKVSDQKVVIVEVFPQSPAEEQGLKINDVILAIDGANVKNTNEVFDKLQVNKEVTFTIDRNNEQQEVKLLPKIMPDHDKPIIGVAMVDTGIIKYGFLASVWKGLQATAVLSSRVLEALYMLFYNLLTQGKVSADLSGPIGVAVITGQVAQMGFIYLLQFAAILSINLGIINILPFPALDGGRLLFILIEKIRRKKVSEKIEGISHNVGFILLMALVVVITYRDLQKYGVGFFEKIKNLF
jgi:regulator of sigma E protease